MQRVETVQLTPNAREEQQSEYGTAPAQEQHQQLVQVSSGLAGVGSTLRAPQGISGFYTAGGEIWKRQVVLVSKSDARDGAEMDWSVGGAGGDALAALQAVASAEFLNMAKVQLEQSAAGFERNRKQMKAAPGDDLKEEPKTVPDVDCSSIAVDERQMDSKSAQLNPSKQQPSGLTKELCVDESCGSESWPNEAEESTGVGAPEKVESERESSTSREMLVLRADAGIGETEAGSRSKAAEKRKGSQTPSPHTTKRPRQNKSSSKPANNRHSAPPGSGKAADVKLYCVCNSEWRGDSFMVGCEGSDECDRWFHPGCVGLSRADEMRFKRNAHRVKLVCDKCSPRNAFTVMHVRSKSQRNGDAAASGGGGSTARRRSLDDEMEDAEPSNSRFSGNKRRAIHGELKAGCVAKGEDEELFCVCRRPYRKEQFMVMCEQCEQWFHPRCVGFSDQVVRRAHKSHFFCAQCSGVKVESAANTAARVPVGKAKLVLRDGSEVVGTKVEPVFEVSNTSPAQSANGTADEGNEQLELQGNAEEDDDPARKQTLWLQRCKLQVA